MYVSSPFPPNLALEHCNQKCPHLNLLSVEARVQISPRRDYEDHVPNRALDSRFRDAFNHLEDDVPTAELDYMTGSTMASTNRGNFSYAMPLLSPFFWIRSEDDKGNQLGGPHTPDFEKAARTEESRHLALRVAKAPAATAIDVLTMPELLREVQEGFEDVKRREGR